ncbi:MAG: phenylalanine--tRNA ligase beta subunit-related protein [Pseudomonadota bacterium]
MLDIAVCKAFAKANVPVTLGALHADVTVTEPGQALGEALDKVAAERLTSLSGGTVGDISQISETRKAYKMLGKDPSRYRPSAEALMRRLTQGKGIYRINNVVDTNNLISLKTGFSIGAYDAKSIEAPVVFRKGETDEGYKAIGRGRLNLENLPIFVDGAGPFGSPTSDSERTLISMDTDELLMVIIGFGETPDVSAALEFAAERLRLYCYAKNIRSDIATNRPL